jgi:hypothetical protein
MLTLRGSEPVVRQVGSDSIDVEEVSLFGSLDHLKKRSRPSGTTGGQQEHALQSCTECPPHEPWQDNRRLGRDRFLATSPPGQPVQGEFSALGGGVASVSCHSLPFASVHNSCAIRCSNPNHVALVSKFCKYLISASFRVLGGGVVASNSLMAARSRSEGRTICEPSRTCTCRDVWLHYVNCIWIRHTSSARKTAIAGVNIVTVKRRKIETLMCVIHVLVTCLLLAPGTCGRP